MPQSFPVGNSLNFGFVLRTVRQSRGETLVTFAALLGISFSYLSDIERGRRMVNLHRVAEWATTLGFKPSDFVQMVLQQQVAEAGLAMHVRVDSDVPAPG